MRKPNQPQRIEVVDRRRMMSSSAKEKVLAVYPSAYGSVWNGRLGVHQIWSSPSGGTFLGQSEGQRNHPETISKAWADAASRLPSAPAPPVEVVAEAPDVELPPISILRATARKINDHYRKHFIGEFDEVPQDAMSIHEEIVVENFLAPLERELAQRGEK